MRMSTAALLVWRTVQTRPRRTGLLLAGYGLGVAVMIALLAVGDALLMQAQDRDVVAGGDLVLVPAGIDPDVLKTGAVTAMFLSIPNARFLVRQILLGPRYAETIEAVSPEIIDKLVYLRVRGEIHAARASGALPAAAAATRSALTVSDAGWRDRNDDHAWLTPSSQGLLSTIDRFHEPPAGPEGSTWAEWWYFNFADDNGVYGYIAFVADHDRRVHVGVTLHHTDGRVLRFEGTHSATSLPFTEPVLAAGPHRVEVREGAYAVRIEGLPASRATPAALPRPDVLSADLVVRPVPGWVLAPFEQQSGTFRTGYVVPALRAAVSGALRLNGETLRIVGTGYHDHNWGIWQAVTWEWGTASTREYALLAGLVRHPALRGQEMLVTLFSKVNGRAGVLGVLRGSAPAPRDWKPGPVVGGLRLRVPGRLRYRAANDAGDRLDAEIAVGHVVATSFGLAPGGSAERPVFLQIRGRYTVRGVVGGRPVTFTAVGFAETFVPLRAAP